MYTITPITKTVKLAEHDFMFTDFTSFYKTANTLTFKLTGRWTIGIKTDAVQDVKDFLNIEEKYQHLSITIYMSEKQVDYLTMYDQHVNTSARVKPFEIFKGMCSNRNLLFAKNVDLLVYRSIEHDVDSMENAVNLMYQKFGSYSVIDEKRVSEYFIINNVVYPRTVVLQYLWLSRWRGKNLQRCINTFGNDIMLYSCIKNIKKLFEEKCIYFKTGNATKLIKSVDTKRLNLMYRVFIAERVNFSDVAILLSLYERGLSCYDFVQGGQD